MYQALFFFPLEPKKQKKKKKKDAWSQVREKAKNGVKQRKKKMKRWTGEGKGRLIYAVAL